MRVPGLTVIEEWIDVDTERALMARIDAEPWLADLVRRVQHYGWRYDYKARAVAGSMRLGPLPDWAAALAQRIARSNLCEREPDQVIVNEYEPGQGIGKHIDCLPCFGPTVLSLSLGSTCVMKLARDAEVVEVTLNPRSLLVLAGEARSEWTHAIPGHQADLIDGVRVKRRRRLSLTFRTIRRDA